MPNVDLHRTDIFLNEAGVDTIEKLPYYKVEEDEALKAHKLVKGRKIIGIQMAAMATVRNWPENRYRELIALIKTELPEYEIFLFNDKGFEDWKQDKVTIITGKSIRNAAALIAETKAMVTLDSGLCHLSGALGVPQVALFGNIDHKCRTKYYDKIKVLQLTKEEMNCVPCWRSDCTSRRCLVHFTAADVVKALKELL